jgi:hypothetical protein
MKKTDLNPFDYEAHARLTKRVDRDFARFIERFLRPTPPYQWYEALRLVADDCYGRMEKLEDKELARKNNAPPNSKPNPPPKPAGIDLVEACRKEIYDLIHLYVGSMFQKEDERIRGLQLLERFLKEELTRLERKQTKLLPREEAQL